MVTRVSYTSGPRLWQGNFTQGTHSGLTFNFNAGDVYKEDQIVTIGAGSVALSASSNNIVYVDLNSTPSIATSTISSPPTQTQAIYLYYVTTVGSDITDVLDLRNWTMGRTSNTNLAAPSPLP
jgi:hypothetical protein